MALTRRLDNMLGEGGIARWSVAGTYSIAIGAVAVSYLIRVGLDHYWLGGGHRLIAFVPVVLLVTYYLGAVPAALIGAISVIAFCYAYTPPFHSFRLDPSHAASSAIAVVGIAASIFVIHRLRLEANKIRNDLRGLNYLHQLGLRLTRSADYKEALYDIVQTAVKVSRADKGNVQLYDESSDALRIAAHHGFQQPFVDFFDSARDDNSACTATMRSSQTESIEDVTKNDIFPNKATLEVLLKAGVRAFVSTPLIDSRAKLLGMVSVHFSKPRRPSVRELKRLELLSRQVTDYLERRKATQIEQTLKRELQHRTNNLLAVVQSIAYRSFLRSKSLAEGIAAFNERLQALAHANRQLLDMDGTNGDLAEIVKREFALFPNRMTFEGPTTKLAPEYAQKFTLAIHELLTNAVKYGSLSYQTGTVRASWSTKRDGVGAILSFKWEERDGPPISAPTKQGFGSQLIKTSFPNARIDYGAGGLTCEIDVPLPTATAARRASLHT